MPAMLAALRTAEMEGREVGNVSANATWTSVGVAAERRAIAGPLDGEGWLGAVVSSTKGATGHLLRAAGAGLGSFSALVIAEGVVLSTVNLEEGEAWWGRRYGHRR